MKRTGVLAAYRWWEIPPERLSMAAMIRMLAPRLVGLVAVNVSWDSGLMELTPDLAAAGWTTVGRFAMTPVIDVKTTQNWPISACQGGRFDEWYFFRQAPPMLDLSAFCNYGGVSLQDARSLAFPGGVDLEEQLRRYEPELVIGEGEHLFILTRNEALADALDSIGGP